MQTNCQQGTRKNNDHNLLLLLFKHKHPRLVKHQFSLSLLGSPYHLYFDFKEQKVTTSAEVDILVQFSSLNKLSKHCAHTQVISLSKCHSFTDPSNRPQNYL